MDMQSSFLKYVHWRLFLSGRVDFVPRNESPPRELSYCEAEEDPERCSTPSQPTQWPEKKHVIAN